jgi:hypothetical protein
MEDLPAGKQLSQKLPPEPVERHFEKTVEWCFVKDYLPALDFGVPLAGDAEV